MLFSRKNECDELKFAFSKSQQILIHSFCFGDDFNFMVCTNNQVALYDFNLVAKTHKSIAKIEIPYLLSVAACHFEPMACALFLVDKSGQCVVMFLNMRHKKDKTKSLLT